jgi:hypothetical protein
LRSGNWHRRPTLLSGRRRWLYTDPLIAILLNVELKEDSVKLRDHENKLLVHLSALAPSATDPTPPPLIVGYLRRYLV